jgi:hypothetical protein
MKSVVCWQNMKNPGTNHSVGANISKDGLTAGPVSPAQLMRMSVIGYNPQPLPSSQEQLSYWTLSIVRYSKNLRTQRFGKCWCSDLMSAHSKGPNKIKCLHLRTETNSVADKFVFSSFLEYRRMD